MLLHSPDRSRREIRKQQAEGIAPSFKHGWRYLCGTIYEMPTELKQRELIKEAEQAVEYAQAVRAHHARRSKPNNRQRQIDIKLALTQLSTAMRPIRRRIARLSYLQEDGDELKEASQALQRERRKLWKMTNTRKGRREQ